MHRSGSVDPRVKYVWDVCEGLGIEADIKERRKKKIPHHPEARRIFSLIKESDWVFGNDFFRWKEGNECDNGENLMYSLSTLFELIDKSMENEK